MKSSWLFQAVQLFITGQGYVKRNSGNKALLDGLRPVVMVGRFLCAISRNDVLKKQESQRNITVPTILSGLLTIFFCFNIIFLSRANLKRFHNDKTLSEKLGEFSLPGYAATMFFVYGYQLFRGKRFRNIVQAFVEANGRTQISIPFPSSYKRFCMIFILFYMLCGITENIMYDLSNIKKGQVKGVKANSTLELYYVQTFHHWNETIPFNPIIAVVFAIVVKCGTWGWVYMDIIAVVLCKAITEKFRVMNEEINYLISHQQSCAPLKTKIPDHLVFIEGRILTLTWDLVRDEFVMLTDLVWKIQTFIAPLILACYGANMYIIVISLYNWIAPYAKFSFEESSYNYFAFLQFLFRVSSVTYFAAEVHHVSHSIARTVQRCPNSMYSLSLERLERTFICNPTGICLFGTFMITRKFFISIVSFIFTTEIVLLQTANSVRTK